MAGRGAGGSGGGGAVPVRGLSVVQYAELCAREIAAVHGLVNGSQHGGSRRVHQTLPRHMRRRASSHNVKRLPVRLRAAAIAQAASQPVALPKRSRRHRRRPSNLRAEWAGRARKTQWLETHLWQAKRMCMVTRWGCRLASHPAEKSFKALYRAVRSGCVLHDASYFATVEVCGRGALAHLLAHAQPSLVEAASLADGTREHHCLLFDSPLDGDGFICPVSLLVAAGSPSSPDTQRVWVRCHVMYAATLEAFCRAVLRPRGLVCAPVQRVRLELRGPKVTALLQRILKPVDGGVATDTWEALSGLQSTHTLPAGVVLALTVQDPRLTPPSRAPAEPDFATFEAQLADLTKLLVAWPRGVQHSAVWDHEASARVSQAKLPLKALNQRREKLLVPGGALAMGPQDARIPVALIQQPGASGTHAGFGSGWDLVLPRQWGMPFWLALVQAGARVGGMREREGALLEMGACCETLDYPEAISCAVFTKGLAEVERKRHLSRPPAKRLNYATLGIPSPFECDWEAVARAGGLAGGGNCVELPQPTGDTRSACWLPLVERRTTQLQAMQAALRLPGPLPEGAHPFIPVMLTMSKGAVSRCSHVTLLQPADWEAYLRDASWSGPQWVGKRGEGARPVIGSITSSAVSQVHGRCVCKGLVLRSALAELCDGLASPLPGKGKARKRKGGRRRSALLLVRNTTSRHFRLARVDVLMR